MSSDNSDTSTNGTGYVLLALGTGAAIGFGWVANDWITAGFVLLILVMALPGFGRGGAAISASVLAMLAAIRLAEVVSPVTSDTLGRFVAVPDQYRGPANLAFAGLVIAVCVYVAVRIVASLILTSFPGLRQVDRWAGAILGSVQGGLICMLLLFSAVILEPAAARHARTNVSHDNRQLSSRLSGNVVTFVESARKSSLRGLLEAMDPLKKRVHEHAQEMAHAIAGQQSSDPTIQTGLLKMADSLRNDPAALRTFSTRFGFDEASVRAVLGSSEFEEMTHRVAPGEATP